MTNNKPLPDGVSDERLREIIDAARSYIGANGYDPDPEEIIGIVTELLTRRDLNSDAAAALKKIAESRFVSDGWVQSLAQKTLAGERVAGSDRVSGADNVTATPASPQTVAAKGLEADAIYGGQMLARFPVLAARLRAIHAGQPMTSEVLEASQALDGAFHALADLAGSTLSPKGVEISDAMVEAFAGVLAASYAGFADMRRDDNLLAPRRPNDHARTVAKRALESSLLDLPHAGERDGWKLVPVKATEAMLEAGASWTYYQLEDDDGVAPNADQHCAKLVYQAMLSAVPLPTPGAK